MRQASLAGIKMPAEAVDVESTDCATILERVTFWRAARASQYTHMNLVCEGLAAPRWGLPSTRVGRAQGAGAKTSQIEAANTGRNRRVQACLFAGGGG